LSVTGPLVLASFVPSKYEKSEVVQSLDQVSRELEGVVTDFAVSDRVSDCDVQAADPDQGGDLPD